MGFYGKTTLTQTLDLPLPVGDIARRRRHQLVVRFEATFTGLHEGSASLSILAGITFHVLRVPNRRYPGPHLHGGEELTVVSRENRNVTFHLLKERISRLNARKM